ncbi:MAG: T9SS type A sorting domain-containing protein [Ferruginibacter sp.]
MKKFLLPALLLMLAQNSFSQARIPLGTVDQLTTLATIPGKPVNNKTVDQQWQSKAEQYIAETEYYFKKDGNSPVFYAANRAQRLGFSINELGYKISPEVFLDKKTIQKNWVEDISFAGIRRGKEALLPNKQYSYKQNKGELNYRYPGFSIQYINNEKGLRQNFVVNKKLPGTEKLELLLKYKGLLTPVVGDRGIVFSNNGFTKLFYEDLKVWDANQQILNAKFEVRDDNIIAIIVEDSMAAYPITIDPLNKVPEWTGTAEGILPPIIGQLAIDAAYGYSVAGVGDVNEDGFDDVAIGAPAMVDVIAGTGSLAAVGAVFVYYGSPTGLPVAPSAMLQPTTSVAGALFGYSIAGGDVNNDGNDDIIVGAPLDNIIVNGQSGTVGKAYVFDGANLSTNTTPFLSIQLSGNTIIKEGINLSVNALFGFSVAVTEDLNGDGKNDMIVGSPTYAGIKNDLFGNPTLLDVQSGGAFIFLTNASNNNLAIVKLEPIKTNLLGILSFNINGLLFGYSVDGLGDYNNDGHRDVVATAPAGIDLGLISILLNGKLLQGSATVYYGTGAGVNINPGAVLTATSGGLLTNLTGSIGNIANLFGTSVRGVRDAAGVRNGNLLVGAPLGGALMNVLTLQLKTGTVSVFVKKASSPAGNVIPDQVLSSPRNSNTILSIIQCNLLFGYSLDNVRDVNCDGLADIIVGEPASSGAQLINANVSGGAAYIYFGKGDGTYYSLPYWTLTAEADAFLGINATALIGYSVAGAGKIRGTGNDNYVLAGSPSRTLDFGTGLLNLGNTFGTLFGLLAGNNGIGKAFLFQGNLCAIVLPVTMSEFTAIYYDGVSHLSWTTSQESNSSHFEIERSIDGINYTRVGTVTAAGNSSNERNYVFNDVHPVSGINYYRFKMMDKDGRSVYSNIKTVNVTIKGNTLAAIYPSPFIDKVNIVIANETASKAEVVIFDNAGKLVIKHTVGINKGINTIRVENLGKLAKGFYIIKVSLDQNVFTQKLVK